jgi:hypothetical protein
LLGLELQEIYGIGERMEQRLHRAGIFTVAELWQASPMRLRRVWGGINGWLFHQMLHGIDTQPPSSRLRQKHGPPASRCRSASRLLDLVPASAHQPDLFDAANHRRQKLSPMIDRINDRYGRCAIGFSLLPPDVRAFKGQAAFHRVPETTNCEVKGRIWRFLCPRSQPQSALLLPRVRMRNQKIRTEMDGNIIIAVGGSSTVVSIGVFPTPLLTTMEYKSASGKLGST